MTEQERGCEHCAYKYDQKKGKTLDTLKKTGIRHCFFHHFSFMEGAIVDCDNWKTDDISTQFEERFGFFLPRKLIDFCRKVKK